MRKNTGFTLIEVMIVLALIAIIAAIAIPNLIRAQIDKNERAAIYDMGSIISAEGTYKTANSSFAVSLPQLTAGTVPYLAGNWSSPRKGYVFTIGGTAENYTVNADPTTPGTTGNRHFYADKSGVIRSSIYPADAGSTPLDD